jgi:phosphoglycolate phosphatase
MNRNALLIFDLDGTLFRTETVTIPAVQRGFSEFGLPVPSEEEVFAFIGRPHSDFQDWIRSKCNQGRATELVATVDRLELELVSVTGELYPSIVETLESLCLVVESMALCTNGHETYVKRVIATHRLEPFFDIVRFRRSSADSKPTMVRELLAQLFSRPAMVIGDRHDDIAAAHENGIQAIAALYGYGSSEELVSANASADSPSELPKLVRSLLSHSPQNT